ncbi:MAG: 30S ribosomal protein S6 [Patescibacteria group bacterium]|jgi:small subunit ribosomal protein S6
MKYELSFIISPAIAETEHLAVNQQVLGYLKGIEAKITREPYFMGRRKLAYPIAKQKQGFYVSLEFETEDSKSLKEVDTKLKHNNSLLRYLVIRLENRSKSVDVDFSKMVERDMNKDNAKTSRKTKTTSAKPFFKKAADVRREPSKDIDKNKDKGTIKLEDIDKKLDAILEEPKLD